MLTGARPWRVVIEVLVLFVDGGSDDEVVVEDGSVLVMAVGRQRLARREGEKPPEHGGCHRQFPPLALRLGIPTTSNRRGELNGFRHI